MKNYKFTSLSGVKIAVLIFLIASTYTTQIGFVLILGDESIDKILMSWGISIAISIFLYYFSTLIPKFIRDFRIFLLSIAYLIFASLSIFFNFNFFYEKLSLSDELELDVSQLRSKVIDLRDESIIEYEKKIKLKFHKLKVDSLEAELLLEIEHPLRPGDGIIAFSIKKELELKKNKYDYLTGMFNEFKSEIDSISSDIVYRLDNTKATDYTNHNKIKKNDLKIAIAGYNEMGVQIINRIPTFNFVVFKNQSTQIGKTGFALSKLIQYFSDKLESHEITNVRLSFFFSCLLDLPILIALIAVNLKDIKKYPDEKTTPFDSTINSELQKENLWDYKEE